MNHTRSISAFPGCRVDVLDGVSIVTLRGSSLDGRLVKSLRKQVLDVIARHSRVIVDFGGVVFLDAAGLDAVWEWVRSAQARHTEVRLVNCSKSVAVLLQIVRIPKAVPVFGNVGEALASLADRQSVMARTAS